METGFGKGGVIVPTLIAAFALLGMVAATSGEGAIYRDEPHGFEIAQPQGWVVAPSPAVNHFKIAFAGPHNESTGENCSVTITTGVAPAGSQGDLNKLVTNGALFREQMREWTPFGQDIVVLSHSISTLGGLPAQESVALVKPRLAHGAVMKYHDKTTLTPGHSYSVGCTALEGSYDAVKDEMDRIQRSFRFVPTSK
jgi:hypothetical protein